MSRRKQKRKAKAPPAAVAASPPVAGSPRPGGARRMRQLIFLLAALGLVGLLAYQNVLVPRRHLEALPRPDLATAEAPVASKVRELLEALRRHPSSGSDWGRLAVNLDVHDFKPEAVSCYRKAVELEPDEFLWSYFGALALDDVGSEEALEWFARARELRKDYAPLHIHEGRARLQAGRVDEAEASFEEALRLDSEAVFARLGLGQILLMRGDLEASRRHLNAAIETAPRFREAYGLLAEVHRRQGDLETVKRLRSMLPRLPDKNPIPDPLVETRRNREGVSAYWCDVRGRGHMAAGLAGKAVEAFEAAIAARPGTPDFHNRLGTALVQAGRPEEAIGAFRKALELAPGYAQAYVNLGGVQVVTGRVAEGIATLREGLQEAPDNPGLLHALAWILASAPDGGVRDGGEAVSLARRLVTLRGDQDPVALDVLAAAYAASGRFEEAEDRARQAVRLAEGAPVAEEIEARLELYEKGRPFVSRALSP